MSFRPSVIIATAVLLPALLAGCAAAPELEAADPGTAAPAAVKGGKRYYHHHRPTTTTTTVPGSTVPSTSVPPTTAPVPTTAPPTTVPSGGFVPAFPGDVAPGAVRWGAAVGGNADPARHESVAGVRMGLRRTFFSWSQRTGSMVSTAKGDLAAGRVPWVSIKPPSWADMANGTYDGQIDEMLRALDALNGPVWLTVHHEPEGGGGSKVADDPAGAPAWRAMQVRIRARMNALGTDNIAFAPILMAWTFNPSSGRNPADWWVDGVWDFAGNDHYMDKATATSVWSATWIKVNSFYASKGLKVALGEWGNVGTDGVAAAEMTDFYSRALASGSTPGTAQVIGMSYFDSNLNSPKTGGWELFGEPLNRFRQIMTLPGSVSANEVR